MYDMMYMTLAIFNSIFTVIHAVNTHTPTHHTVTPHTHNTTEEHNEEYNDNGLYVHG